MTECPKCQVEHDLGGWPETWDPVRQDIFIQRMLRYDVLPSMVPSMACELEHLQANENDLEEYFIECKKNIRRLSQVELNRLDALGWSFAIINPLTITREDPLVAKLVKLGCLLLVGVPILILTAPIRLWYWLRFSWVRDSISPTFREWIYPRKRGY